MTCFFPPPHLLLLLVGVRLCWEVIGGHSLFGPHRTRERGGPHASTLFFFFVFFFVFFRCLGVTIRVDVVFSQSRVVIVFVFGVLLWSGDGRLRQGIVRWRWWEGVARRKASRERDKRDLACWTTTRMMMMMIFASPRIPQGKHSLFFFSFFPTSPPWWRGQSGGEEAFQYRG